MTNRTIAKFAFSVHYLCCFIFTNIVVVLVTVKPRQVLHRMLHVLAVSNIGVLLQGMKFVRPYLVTLTLTAQLCSSGQAEYAQVFPCSHTAVFFFWKSRHQRTEQISGSPPPAGSKLSVSEYRTRFAST